MPEQKKRKTSEDEVDTVNDLWGSTEDSSTNQSKKKQRFKEFDKKSRVRVKAVVNPHGGQSYNPSAKDHQ